ncbi:MAG: hypothetical protein KKB30_11430 [Proteobacteria bacterium]|nr:hypothetical protein [Pseudomonadota bacterium]MBU1714377.1 hypothetical protein [Pseudomonadota bacterium]
MAADVEVKNMLLLLFGTFDCQDYGSLLFLTGDNQQSFQGLILLGKMKSFATKAPSLQAMA